MANMDYSSGQQCFETKNSTHVSTLLAQKRASQIPATVSALAAATSNTLTLPPASSVVTSAQSSVMVPPMSTEQTVVTSSTLPVPLPNQQQQQPHKLTTLLQSPPAPGLKQRPKTQTVRNLLPQQTIIIKQPPAQIIQQITPAVVNAQGLILNQQGLQPGQVLQAGQILPPGQIIQSGQDPQGQKFILATQPFLQMSETAKPVEQQHQQQQVVMTSAQPVVPRNETQQSMAPPQVQTVPAPEAPPPHVIEEPMVEQHTPVNRDQHVQSPFANDPLAVLSATAAKEQPLPVPPSIKRSLSEMERESQPLQTQQIPQNSLSPLKPPQTPQTPATPNTPSYQVHIIEPHSETEMDTTPSPTTNGAPVQVIEEGDWEPFREITNQCKKKLEFLLRKRIIDDATGGRLKIINGESYIEINYLETYFSVKEFKHIKNM